MMRHTPGAQHGLTMLMVMVLMTAMLMGALAFARVTEVGTLVSNNLANKDSSFHAAEVGRGVAFAQLQALPTLDNNSGGWYWASQQPIDPATGIPTTVNFATTPQVAGNVGRFTVTYAVERLCNATGLITNSAVQCVVLNKPDDDNSADAANKGYEAPDYMTVGARQYRITVRVTDARGTQTWTQSLVTLN
jgi:type IV pilus assembly protein PilX